MERTRPITVLTVYTGDPKHKVCQVSVSYFVISSSLPKDYGDSVVACQFINALRGASGVGKGRSSPSEGWCTSQRGTLAFPHLNTRLSVIFQDRTRDTNGDIAGKLPFRLYHCPRPGWKLPPRPRATVDEYKSASNGMQRKKRLNSSEAWVKPQIRISNDLS